MQSKHDAKGIAGNIIPAIATTNAIIAGIQVMEAIKILRADKPIIEACKFTYCSRSADRRGTLLLPAQLQPPAEKCYVCGSAQLDCYVDTETTTFEAFLEKVTAT
jgi:ubiquitin-like 1-activating enzyme E1 B